MDIDIRKLYQDACRKVANPECWQQFLSSACHAYERSFDEQVLIYEQRPDATYIAKLETWNRTHGRWVLKDSKGIALFEGENEETGIATYYDVSDTIEKITGSRPLSIWQMNHRYEWEVTESLWNSFGELATRDFAKALIQTAKNATNDHLHDYFDELKSCTDGSLLEELDELNLGVTFRTLTENSIAHILLQRCGYDPARYFEREDFVGIGDFNTIETINAVGCATGDVSRMILKEISETVKIAEAGENRTFGSGRKYLYDKEHTERRRNHGRTDIHEAGGLSYSRPVITNAGNPAWQICTNEKEIPERTQTDNLHQSSDDWETERSSAGNRTGSERENHPANSTDSESGGGGRGNESNQSGYVDRADEQLPPVGGGNGAERTDIRLVSESGLVQQEESMLEEDDSEPSGKSPENIIPEPAQQLEQNADGDNLPAFSNEKTESPQAEIPLTEKEGGQQLSFFDLPALPSSSQQEENTVPLRLQLPQQVIDEALCIGANEKNSRLTICAYFRKDKTPEENTSFLMEHYGTNGVGFVHEARKYALWYNSDGLYIAGGESAQVSFAAHITWGQAAKRIRELLDLGRYMSKEELYRVAEFEISELAKNLLFIVRDFSDEAKDTGFTPTIRKVFSEKGGFPAYEKRMQELLKDTNSLDQIVTEWERFTDAHEQNASLLRFRYYRPKKSLQKLHDLQREQLTFTIAENYAPDRQIFVSQDEIDKQLRAHRDYRLNVYSFFCMNRDAKARKDYLKRYHGEYSGSYGGNDNRLYTMKGLSFSHGNISAPYANVFLNWNQITKRITKLISSGKWLSNEDRAAMPDYELGCLARTVHNFFTGADEDFPVPFKANSLTNYREGVDEVKEQLTDPAQVGRIYQYMMLPLWESTPQDYRHYSLRKEGIEAMQAYRNGTYSVFGTDKTLFRLRETPDISVLEKQEFKEETVSVYPAEKNNLPYDVEIHDLRTEPERDAATESFESKAESVPSGQQIEDKMAIAPPEKEESPVFKAPKCRRETLNFEMVLPDIPAEERRNFHITDSQLGVGSATEKYQSNINAIRTLQQIEDEDRLATAEEQEVLSHYVGWGGLSSCFDETHANYAELKAILTREEYAAARASSLTAFYTPPVIINAMYQALYNMGFREGNVLEPSCGIGNFIGNLPENFSNSNVYGVEIDSISGRIARQLYQNSQIAVAGFEKVTMPDSFFDVAIGNVPFGDFRVADKRYDKNNWLIHDYFFGKTLDKVRPGGIIVFITSKGTLDKSNPAVRKYIAQRADLIGAIRLPNNAFKANAGTEVTSDIIFLQKKDRMTDIEPAWVHLDKDENGIAMNSYFVEHPEMILGNMVMKSGRFGAESTCKAFGGSSLAELLNRAITNLHAEISVKDTGEIGEDTDLSIPADPNVRNFSYCIHEGKIYFREDSRMYPAEGSVTAENRIRGMIALRDCVRQLIEYQSENYPDDVVKRGQERLNSLYDDFTKKYGYINSRGNSLAFSDDSGYYLLCSLEVFDNEGNFQRKADMFSKRTIRPHEPVTSVDTASEALAVSIAEKAKVDMEYMEELTGKSAEQLEEDLGGVIFRDILCAEDPKNIPESFADLTRYSLITADEYLSGNVRKKLRMAKALHEVLPPEKKNAVEGNIEALAAVQPQDLTAAEISVRIGSNWVPVNIYNQFMHELIGTPSIHKDRIRILRSGATGEWHITHKTFDRENIKANTTYGSKRMSAYHILEQSLNQKDARVFDYIEEDGKTKAVLNKKETAIVQDRQGLIKQKFSEWIWSDIERREQLCSIYNEKFNSKRPRKFDGSHIVFSGMNPEISLRKHQIDAIAHILYGGNTLLAHEVGAGKTFEMAAAAMEMKRLGLCTKSLIVVPNHITGQWASEWMQLYPSANLLVATKKDFETKNRKKFCARIATGDYDAVIIGHSQFEKIPISAQRQCEILQQQIDEIMFSIEEAKSEKAENYTIKQLEQTRKSLKTKLERLTDRSRKDDIVTFEELGVDRIFIDESHYFKNLFLATKMRNVSGITQTGAQKSSDLFMKCRYLDEITNGRGTIFATGTPISNSMVELYTIQRYLQYSTLEEMDLIHFDDWASTFGETITAIELSPEGSGYRAKTRFAKFFNLPELMSVFKQVADIQTADMLHLPVPKANFHTVVIKPTELQKKTVEGLAERAEKVRNGNVDPQIDNMLLITNDGRKLALDMRLINPLAEDAQDGKTATCAKIVHEIWERTKENRSTQLIFCDLSTPKNDGSFNVYDDIRDKLVEKGIPEDEIAYIHHANTDARKQALFAKVRAGQVRVLMGSTQKMGAGTNVQDRLIAIHDLDCPWRPSDLAQRLGRPVRQGNQNPEVEIYRYVTEGTFDAYLYQLVENKQKIIAQIMTSKAPVRVADDVDESALNYAEIKALASGNPLILEKCNLDMEVGKLNVLKANFLNQRYALEDLTLRKYPQQITELTERIAGYEKDIDTARKHPKPDEGFVGMEIFGRRYAEKEDAGKEILAACKRLVSSESIPFGNYRGFEMRLSYDGFSTEYHIALQGRLFHKVRLGADTFGNITRLDNVISDLENRRNNVQTQLDEVKTQLKNAKVELQKSFAKETELAEKENRLKEVNILLNMDQKDAALIDSEIEEVPEKTKAQEHER